MTAVAAIHSDFERLYAVHGVGLRMRAGRPDILDWLDRRLSAFSQGGDVAKNELCFDFTVLADRRPHLVDELAPPVRLVYESARGHVLYREPSDELFVAYGGIRALCRASVGSVSVSIEKNAAQDAWAISRAAFSLPLMELLKRRGLYAVHAAGVAIGGRSVLIAGGSGAGKTTLALALVRHGFGFLADDTVFLADDAGSGLNALPFPDELDVTEETVRLFPETRQLAGEQLLGGTKRQLDVTRLGATPILEGCPPAVLLFPEVGRAERSTFEPIGPDGALRELAPNVLLTEPRSTQAHLDALAELAGTARAFRVRVGRDFETVSARVEELAR